jgi:TATA-box binding protein (TBP) (component of TFIID and TFIIIB)
MKVVSKNQEEYAELQNKLSTIPYYNENIIKQINNPDARRIKFKDERKITVGLSRKDIVNTRGKTKNAFYNCFAMILRFQYEGKFKEIHVKVFNTGKLEIPGVINMALLETAKVMIYNILQPLVADPIIFIENLEFDNVLINSNFNCGFYINRDKLHATLRSEKYGIESAYDPCSYPGIKCRFYFSNKIGFSDLSRQTGRILPEDSQMKMSELIDSKKYTEISFMIFRTGSGLVVGNCTDKILYHVFDVIKKILQEEFLNIRALNETASTKDKTLKLRKRSIVVSNDYYCSLTNHLQN